MESLFKSSREIMIERQRIAEYLKMLGIEKKDFEYIPPVDLNQEPEILEEDRVAFMNYLNK